MQASDRSEPNNTSEIAAMPSIGLAAHGRLLCAAGRLCQLGRPRSFGIHFARIRIAPPFGSSISKAFVFRTRSPQLAKAKVPGVEIRGQICKLITDRAKGHPAILALHLRDN